jgi:Spy/CpxP family protein refolding chaperone
VKTRLLVRGAAALALTAGLVLGLGAAPADTPTDRMMIHYLRLTTAQRGAIEKINQTYAARFSALAQAPGTNDEKRKRGMELEKKRQGEIARVLTAEQQRKFKQLQNPAVAERAQFDFLASELKLSATQKQKIAAIRSAGTKRGEGIAKQIAALQRRLEQIDKEIENKSVALLTPQQKVIYNRIRAR